MALTVAYAFDQFFSAINLPGDHRELANNRKDWIVRRLNSNLTILDSFPMGSIPRFTALKGHADLDVMVVLHYGQHVKGRKPSAVLSTVRSALGAGAGSVRRNGQAVTMKFVSWPDVDVVPAVRITNNDGSVSHFQIPDMNREEWIDTRPHSHSKQMQAAASARGPEFRKIVKMLKDWNRRQDVSIQSYHLEVIALRMSSDWEDTGWAIYQWFAEAEKSMHFLWHSDSDVTAYLEYPRAIRAIEQCRVAKDAALNAWYYSRGTAKNEKTSITAWRSIFGMTFPAYG